jgi:hypothetical protein
VKGFEEEAAQPVIQRKWRDNLRGMKKVRQLKVAVEDFSQKFLDSFFRLGRLQGGL